MTNPARYKPNQEMDALWGDQAQGNDPGWQASWFQQEKYALFVHWGLNSLLGGEWQGKTYYGIGEWIMDRRMAGIPVEDYRALAGRFDPIDFDAKAIVDLAREAGMRCIVFTAKHHEGFAMYDSAASDFTIVKASPFGRDVFAELATACNDAGIRLGFYYSQFQDWIEPDGGNTKCELPPGYVPDFGRYFDTKVVPQVRELLSNYGPISVVWFDTPGSMEAEYSQRLVELVHEVQPGCLINNRVGNGLGDYTTLGDMELPTVNPGDGLFECIDTINDSWAFARHDSNWKSPSEVTRNLVRVLARGCNFMLNIGPDGRGHVPAPALDCIRSSGQWVSAHAEAIYGTTGSPFPPFSWGDCTVKGQNLYLQLFTWPRSGMLDLAAVSGRVLEASLLSGGDPLKFSQDGDRVRLLLPATARETPISVIRLRLDRPPAALHQDLSIDGEHATALLAEYATCHGATRSTKRWMETFGEWKKTEVLERWFEQDSARVTWPVNVLAPGRYIVSIDYTCTVEDEGSEWDIVGGSGAIRFYALPSGQQQDQRRRRFRSADCGVLEFTRVGRQRVNLAPTATSKPREIEVRALHLRPWA